MLRIIPAQPAQHTFVPHHSEYKTGETFWSATDAVHASDGLEGPGMYVVLSGVIRRVHHRPDGTKKVGREALLCLLTGRVGSLRGRG